MKLIKINSDHYIVVDDSEIKEGDYVYNISSKTIFQAKKSLIELINSPNVELTTNKKITHSTQPESLGMGWMQSVLPLFLSEVKELTGEVDVEKKAYRFRRDYQDSFKWMNECLMNDAIHRQEGYKAGYNQALEDNKHRKYTEEDMQWALHHVKYHQELTIELIIEALHQPKTEWEVEIVDGKLKLKQ